MGYLPGFYGVVTYGRSTLIQPNGKYNISGLTAALVYHQEEAEWAHRWTTWALDADSTLLYQPVNGPNKLFIGNNGHLYWLDDETTSDNGKAIPIEIVTGPLPEVVNPDAAGVIYSHTFKRTMKITWDLATPPPTLGYKVTVRLTDVSNASNFVERTVTQLASQIEVALTIRCRQFFLSLQTTVSKDFDIVAMSISFQQDGARSTSQQQV